MGCFDYRCGITGLAIRADDPVFYVALKPVWYVNPGSLMFMSEWVSTVGRQEYALKDKKVSSDASTKTELYHRLFRLTAVSKYNWYGSVEYEGRSYNNEDGLPDGADYWDWQFMVHLSAAEAVVERSLSGYNDFSYEEKMDVMSKLLQECTFARIDLFTSFLNGTQHLQKEEVKVKRRILGATEKLLKQQADYLMDWEREIGEGLSFGPWLLKVLRIRD